MRDRRGMSNVLKVSLQTTIYSLADRGWSQRRIAREFGINRETVGRYLRLAGKAKPLNTACAKAIKSGTYRLKDVRRPMGEQPEQSAFGFAENHPLIRDLKTYSDFINQYHYEPQHDDPHSQTTS